MKVGTGSPVLFGPPSSTSHLLVACGVLLSLLQMTAELVVVVVVKMDAWAVGTFLDKKLGSARLSMMSRLWTQQQPTTA